MIVSLSSPVRCQFTARRGFSSSRVVHRRPHGVLTSGPTNSGQSFVKVHQEVLQDSEWYGPEAPDHTTAPAAAAAAPATTANRSDVRLITSFTRFLKSNKLNLQALFCTEPILSADSLVLCDLQAGHHGELLSEYLTSGNLRVGEELPHWFVNGNVRGAIKCWMATRPAAVALTEALAADPHQIQQQHDHNDRVASVARHGPLGATARALVDPLLSAMPPWAPGHVQELAGWEPAPGVQATAEDVAMLHCFGAIVYSSRLDVTVFLQQLCGADPFSWAMAQVAQGVVSEPEPWLLERFFMSTHTVGQTLPIWFATWGVLDEIRKWLGGEQAAAMVRSLLDARGAGDAAVAVAASASADSAAPSSNGPAAAVFAYPPAAGQQATLTASLDRLEAAADSILTAALARDGLSLPAATSSPASIRRGALLADAADPSGVSYPADFVAVREGAAALVAVAMPLGASSDPGHGGGVGDVRQAKERLDWLGFLVQQEGGLEPAAVVKVLLLVDDEAGGATGAQLLPSVAKYLEQSRVRGVWARELPPIIASP